MTGPAGAHAYPLHRGHVWLSLGACVLMAAAGVLMAVVFAGAWKVIGIAMAVVLLPASAPAVRLLADPRPVLMLSSEGLLYRPFADRSAPWRDITAISFVRGYTRSVAWGRSTWRRQAASDQINFALADYAGYPNDPARAASRAMQRLSGVPPIVMQLWLVEESGEAICAEIARHWPGRIAIVERRLQDEPAA